MMRFFARRPKMKPWLPLVEKIARLVELCARQLRAWADSLQHTEIKGQRHLTNKSRVEYGKKKALDEGQKKWQQAEREALLTLPDGHPFKEAMRRKGKI